MRRLLAPAPLATGTGRSASAAVSSACGPTWKRSSPAASSDSNRSGARAPCSASSRLSLPAPNRSCSPSGVDDAIRVQEQRPPSAPTGTVHLIHRQLTGPGTEDRTLGADLAHATVVADDQCRRVSRGRDHRILAVQAHAHRRAQPQSRLLAQRLVEPDEDAARTPLVCFERGNERHAGPARCQRRRLDALSGDVAEQHGSRRRRCRRSRRSRPRPRSPRRPGRPG